MDGILAKKMRLLSRCSNSKLDHKYEEDRISQLPDEIIVSIVSLLTITEAASTSVLSHRWEKLWTFFTGSLILDAGMPPFRTIDQFGKVKRSKFVNLVNKLLNSFDDSSHIKELVVCFNARKEARPHIERWVQFALNRRVERLELNIGEFQVDSISMPYTFSPEFGTRIKQPGDFSCLKYLSLTTMCLVEEPIYYLLTNCPLLEHLSLTNVEQLKTLKITGASARKLKYLYIFSCTCLEYLEISAPKLVASELHANYRSKVHFENVPQLIKLVIGYEELINSLDSSSTCFSQLKSLELTMLILSNRFFTQCVKLTNLKHLTLSLSAWKDSSPLQLGWTTLIKAAPFLRKFTLELDFFRKYVTKEAKMREISESRKHECLKVVEVIGFAGCQIDSELIKYLLVNSTSLEQVIIKCHKSSFISWPCEVDSHEVIHRRALMLTRELSPSVDVVII